MEMADGSYSIQARAAPARGGSTGAYEVAHKDAMAFCQQRGKRAVLNSGTDRDVYQSAGAIGWNQYGGGGSAGTFAAGSATINFRCV